MASRVPTLIQWKGKTRSWVPHQSALLRRLLVLTFRWLILINTPSRGVVSLTGPGFDRYFQYLAPNPVPQERDSRWRGVCIGIPHPSEIPHGEIYLGLNASILMDITLSRLTAKFGASISVIGHDYRVARVEKTLTILILWAKSGDQAGFRLYLQYSLDQQIGCPSCTGRFLRSMDILKSIVRGKHDYPQSTTSLS